MRIVIAEDSVLLREGLAKLLEDEGIEVVGRAEDADSLLLRVRSYRPDVAIVDVRMPPTHTDEGARAAVTIREEPKGSTPFARTPCAAPSIATTFMSPTMPAFAAA